MGSQQPRLSSAALDDLARQLGEVAERCADDQVLFLADGLHDIIRSRRMARWEETRSFEQGVEDGLIITG